MERAPVEVRVGGQTYRVVGSTSADDMQRLAHVVEGKLRELPGAGALHPQSMLLVAMSLAHELEHERALRRKSEQRSRELLTTLLDRVDAALELVDEELPVDDTAATDSPEETQPEA
jgi:cell division protein ZapA